MAHPKAFLIVSLIIIVAGVSAKAEPVTSNVITFDEFPEGTYITDQYSYMGIIFGGDDPFITTDPSIVSRKGAGFVRNTKIYGWIRR